MEKKKEAASSAIATRLEAWLKKHKEHVFFYSSRWKKKRSNEWSRLLLRACQKCCWSCGLIVDPHLACCCCSLKKTDLTHVEPSCSIHSVPVSMTAWSFHHEPDETGSLKLINLLQCCIIIFYIYVVTFFLKWDKCFSCEKESAYQETNDHCKYCV